MVISKTANVTVAPVDYAQMMEIEAGKLKNDSAEGSYNMPDAEICKHFLSFSLM